MSDPCVNCIRYLTPDEAFEELSPCNVCAAILFEPEPVEFEDILLVDSPQPDGHIKLHV